MTTHCTYCGESLPDDEYDGHLERAHAEELTTIERRRVGLVTEHSSGRPLVLYVGVGLVLLVFVLGYVAIFLGPGTATSSAAVQPDPSTQLHEHGTISVQYDDTTVEFSDDQYLEREECFHFHGADDADVWHTHCENVTIEYALESLGMEVTADSVAVGDETFSEATGDTVSITVDGEEVDPQEYVLEGVESVDDARAGAGDHVEIVVESAA